MKKIFLLLIASTTLFSCKAQLLNQELTQQQIKALLTTGGTMSSTVIVRLDTLNAKVNLFKNRTGIKQDTANARILRNLAHVSETQFILEDIEANTLATYGATTTNGTKIDTSNARLSLILAKAEATRANTGYLYGMAVDLGSMNVAIGHFNTRQGTAYMGVQEIPSSATIAGFITNLNTLIDTIGSNFPYQPSVFYNPTTLLYEGFVTFSTQ